MSKSQCTPGGVLLNNLPPAVSWATLASAFRALNKITVAEDYRGEEIIRHRIQASADDEALLRILAAEAHRLQSGGVGNDEAWFKLVFDRFHKDQTPCVRRPRRVPVAYLEGLKFVFEELSRASAPAANEIRGFYLRQFGIRCAILLEELKASSGVQREAAQQVDTAKKQKARRPTTDALLKVAIAQDAGRVGWSVTQFQQHTKRSRASICNAPTWRRLMAARDGVLAAHAVDRRRNRHAMECRSSESDEGAPFNIE